MIRASGKMTLKKNGPDIQKILDQCRGAYVTIGVHEDAGQYDSGVSVVEVAMWNEFGTTNIPERSFLRSTFDENATKINQWRELAIQNILTKGWSVEKALEMIGFRVMTLVQNKIKSNVPPPLAKSTAEKKLQNGIAPRTLIDSGLLLRSITYKVYVK